MELFKFPMKTLNISQGYGYSVDGVSAFSFSHKGKKALDLCGNEKEYEEVYAPCSCKVMRILNSSNIVYFQSLEPVIRSDGKTTYMFWRFIHMNDDKMKELNMEVGKIFKQGEICYYEGKKGDVTGIHCHMEVGEGQYISPGSITKDGITSIINPVYPHQVMFLPDDVVIMKPVYTWKRESSYNAEENKVEESTKENSILEDIDEDTIVPGQNVIINDGILYTASTGEVGIKKYSAHYYVYDGMEVNGRYRVTSSIAYVGKGMKYVSGWVDKNTILHPKTKSDDTSVSDIEGKEFKPGDKVILTGTLYAASTGSSGYKKTNEVYYVFDGKNFNNRLRLVKSLSYVGKSTSMVAGYANIDNLVKG